jgi:drug/metabolite transporter (DMT)-like permease
MIKGMILIALTGLLWCGNGIIFSYAARKSLDFVAIMVVATFLGAILTLAFFSKTLMIFNGTLSRTTELAIIMIGCGMIGTWGVILMQKSMRWGHHGITWIISQSAMIFPFLVGVFMFKETVSLPKIAGLLLVVISFISFGLGQFHSTDQSAKPLIYWFPLAVFSFFILGIHQSLSLVPNHWQNWEDTANLRAMFINAGFFYWLSPATIVSSSTAKSCNFKTKFSVGYFCCYQSHHAFLEHGSAGKTENCLNTFSVSRGNLYYCICHL